MITTQLLRQYDKSDLHVYRLDSSETEWVVASSPFDAMKVVAECWGTDMCYVEDEDYDIIRLHDNAWLKLYKEEPFKDPSPYERMRCKEWAKQGRGFLGSTCY